MRVKPKRSWRSLATGQGSRRRDDLVSALILFALALGMRWPSFDQSVIDHDESTYIVIGQAVWRGELLYTDVWDTKPAGIFLLFGFILKLFGGSIFTIRMLATVAIGGTWTSCSPDFGEQGVLDRFGQVDPKVLFAVDGYRYRTEQRPHDRLESATSRGEPVRRQFSKKIII